MKAFKKKIKKKIRAAKKYFTLKIILPIVFSWYKLKPIDDKLVVFADLRDREMPDNFVGLYNKCKEQGYRYAKEIGIYGSSYTNTMMVELGERLYFAAGSDKILSLPQKMIWKSSRDT